MTDIVRRLVDGVWTTEYADAGGGSLPAGGTTGEVLTKVSDADGDADWQAGGGSQTGFRAVRFPVAFNTPRLNPVTYAITAYDEPTQTITVAGNQTAAFAVGVGFVLDTDFGFQPATLVSSAFAVGSTVITCAPGSLLPETVYENALVTVGVTVYTPTVGDALLGHSEGPIVLVSVSEAWNGSTPTVKVLSESMRQAQSTPFVSLDATAADNPTDGFEISAAPGFTVGTAWRLWRVVSTGPILAYVDDNNGLDPGSSQGAAEIVLLVVTA